MLIEYSNKTGYIQCVGIFLLQKMKYLVSLMIKILGREELHHFLLVLLRGMLPLFSIMTLSAYCTENHVCTSCDTVVLGSIVFPLCSIIFALCFIVFHLCSIVFHLCSIVIHLCLIVFHLRFIVVNCASLYFLIVELNFML